MSKNKKAPEKAMSIETRIYPVKDHGKLLARATVTLGGCFAITGLQILEGKEDQPFVSMPSRKIGEEYKDVCFPCTKEFRQQFHQAVLDAYQQTLDQIPQRRQESGGQNQAPPLPEMKM